MKAILLIGLLGIEATLMCCESDSVENDENNNDSDSDTDSDLDSDSDSETDSDTGEWYPPYLLHYKSSTSMLSHISIKTAEVTDLCEIRDIESGELLGVEGLGYNLPSLTFNREDRLLGSSGGRLWEIHLPSCVAEDLGFITENAGDVFGITPANDGNGLLGISAESDVLIHIDEYDGTTTVIGDLGMDWFMHGATWSDEDDAMYGMRGIDNGLYDVDYTTGLTTLINIVDVSFENVGIEYHPRDGNIYACTNDGNLYLVHPEDGSTDIIGKTGLDFCSNLGAPHGDPPIPPPI